MINTNEIPFYTHPNSQVLAHHDGSGWFTEWCSGVSPVFYRYTHTQGNCSGGVLVNKPFDSFWQGQNAELAMKAEVRKMASSFKEDEMSSNFYYAIVRLPDGSGYPLPLLYSGEQTPEVIQKRAEVEAWAFEEMPDLYEILIQYYNSTRVELWARDFRKTAEIRSISIDSYYFKIEVVGDEDNIIFELQDISLVNGEIKIKGINKILFS